MRELSKVSPEFPPGIPHNQLAKIAHRNIKNVAEDVKCLVQIGLVETREEDRCLAPRVEYDEISLKIAV
jgi:predicted transcriptional regulator